MYRKITLTIISLAFVFLWFLGSYNVITGLVIDDFFQNLDQEETDDLEIDVDNNEQTDKQESLQGVDSSEESTQKQTEQSLQSPQIIPKDIIINEQGGFCGDSIRHFGEDCSSCPTDVKCSSFAYCDNGVCIPKKEINLGTIFLGILSIIFVIGIIITALILVRHKKKTKEAVKVFEKVHEKKEHKPEEKEIVTNYDELEKYIENALRLGYSKEQIRDLLIKSDWKAEDIDFALKRFNQK